MRRSHLDLLACPTCVGPLTLTTEDGDRVQRGSLTCHTCARRVPIVGGIPRFVPLDNYAASFGFEWLKHARTQYDRDSGSRISETRFFDETGWPRVMPGELVLEVGGGSGRFTEHALTTGATVVSVDYSVAVEANYASNGEHENLLIVQADLYRLPFRPKTFDRLYCFGVLQHTPDVPKAFRQLPPMVRQGGHLVVDVYRRHAGLKQLLNTRYWVRPITRRLPPALLYRLVQAYVRVMWPVAVALHQVPVLGRRLVSALLIPDYRGVHDLPEPIRRDWAVLDLFDMLSPRFDQPQTLETVEEWFGEAGLREIDVRYGYNGIQARAITA